MDNGKFSATQEELKVNCKYKTSPQYRFFLYDTENNEMLFFRTEEQRDAAAEALIPLYLTDDNLWGESVQDIVTGYVTGHVVPVDVEFVPMREDYATDEDFQDAQDEISFYVTDDCDFRCNYRLADINDPGESTERSDYKRD